MVVREAQARIPAAVDPLSKYNKPYRDASVGRCALLRAVHTYGTRRACHVDSDRISVEQCCDKPVHVVYSDPAYDHIFLFAHILCNGAAGQLSGDHLLVRIMVGTDEHVDCGLRHIASDCSRENSSSDPPHSRDDRIPAVHSVSHKFPDGLCERDGREINVNHIDFRFTGIFRTFAP